ncbi:MAG: hypothetical protein J6B18_02725 [Bacteroidaceae bacterium]|nr:hypothetical protein [Bacteroidaceae bacterium]
MKKFFIYNCLPLFFAAMVVFSFTACGGDGDDTDYSAIAGIVAPEEKNPIEKEYFKIEGATYIKGAMPESTSSVGIENVTIENNILRIKSAQECKKFYIGVEGVDGYYEVDATPEATRAEPIYYFAVIKLVLELDSKTVTIKCEYLDGSISGIYYYNIPGTPSVTAGTAIDLGLSVKWASCNVGATQPWEYGGYYAWGETEEKSNYSWDTYKYCNDSYISMTKYCTSSSYGTVDNKTTLEPEDDVATVKRGGSWRMPTRAEQDELRKNCTWTWTTLNGVNGCRVTGPNGNSIFLPAAGSCGSAGVYGRGDLGSYWSSSLPSSYSSSFSAFSSGFDCASVDWFGYDRCDGRSVRPVCP